MLGRVIQQVVGANHIRRDRADRKLGVSQRVGVAGSLQDIINILITVDPLIDVPLNKSEVCLFPVAGKTGLGLLLVSAQSDNLAV